MVRLAYCWCVYRKVLPSVQPGYLRPLIPDSIPDSPDQWPDVMSDMDTFIMPGVIYLKICIHILV